jgi:hypothetical protein
MYRLVLVPLQTIAMCIHVLYVTEPLKESSVAVLPNAKLLEPFGIFKLYDGPLPDGRLQISVLNPVVAVIYIQHWIVKDEPNKSNCVADG